MSARYAVFGQPIAHSLSPRIHAAFGAQFGIAVDYRAIEASREMFASTLDAFARDGGRGANVTLPLKEDTARFCATLSEHARRCGSVNTLVREGDHWHGDSTDGIGLMRDLGERHAFDARDRRVLMLGAGGAARAAAFALVDAGVRELVVANRTPERADTLAKELGLSAHSCAWDTLDKQAAFDLVINATSAGHTQSAWDLPRALISVDTLCYDLSYGNAARSFIQWAHAADARDAVDGLGMLVEQAAEAFALWFGRRPETTAVFGALKTEWSQ